ncbi:MAG TPA: TolC family protein [Flavobacteriales bacterium]|nr:TolC family protein [Flavobacteriales bacterium]HPH81106.1 TolC family protein [Flavobacteriales bacterium]
MKNKVLLLLLILSAGLHAQTNDQGSFTLPQAIDFALKNGYSVKNAATDIEIAKKKVAEIRGIGIPQLKTEASFQDFVEVPVSIISANAFNPLAPPGTYLRIPFGVKYNASIGYTASWLAFSGEYIVGLQASKTYVDISKANLRKSEIEVKESVTKAYNLVLILKENKRILSENIASLEQSIEQTSAYNKEGFVEEMDVDRLRLLKNNLSTTLTTLEQQTIIAEKLLKFQMGYDVNAAITLTETLDNLISNAKSGVDVEPKFDPANNIDRILIGKALNLQKLEVKRQKANYLPTLSTFYTWKESRITNEFDQLSNNLFRVPGGTILGVNLSMPVFQGMSQSARVKQAKLNLKKLEVQQIQAEQGIALQSSQSWTAYATALSGLRNTQESVGLATRIRDRAKIKYQEGVGSSLEVIQAENDLLSSQSNYINAVQQLLETRVTLDKNLNKF